MSPTKVQQSIQRKAERTIKEMELFLRDEDTIALLDSFKNSFNLCETVCKTILYEKIKKRKPGLKLHDVKLDMRQIPSAIERAGYRADRNLLSELFGKSKTSKKTVKDLRNDVTHGFNKKSVQKIKDRKDELYRAMESFLQIIRQQNE